MTITTAQDLQRLREAYANHLPERFALERYDGEWLLFGTLTCTFTTSETTQLEYFKTIMDELGARNAAEGRRLHWVVRVEGGEEQHRHLHFLLGKHKVSDGMKRKTSASDAALCVARQWTHGMKRVAPYDYAKEGLRYGLKCIGAASREDTCLMSEALFKHLRKQAG